MTRVFLGLAFLVAVQPAFACHRFSHWAYPWPQRCDIAARIVHRPQVEPKDWYVEIVLTPKVMDEISHGIGIDKIKQLNPGERP
jgi:hypothetical protein